MIKFKSTIHEMKYTLDGHNIRLEIGKESLNFNIDH